MYLFISVGIVVVFIFVLLLNNIIQELENNHQILVNILLKEIAIEEILKKNYNVSMKASNEDILKAIRNTYPHMTEDD